MKEARMFTGLVRDVGIVSSWERRTDSALFSIETKLPLGELQLGASVSCNGACLTVISSSKSETIEHNTFTVEAGPQTLQLTRFGSSDFRGVGALVNLEPALRMGDALGGHVVTGHIDALAKVSVNEATADGFWRLKVAVDPVFGNYLLKKGSIAISGVSLTIADCFCDEHSAWVEIMLIPHTLQQTNLQQLNAGHPVEVEFDSQAKMVADMLRIMLPKQLQTIMNKN